MQTQVNTISLAYDDYGTGLPVVFLHAFPLNRQMWAGEIQALRKQERYRLIALDWRGFGESELPQEQSRPAISHMATLADDLVGLMDVLGIARATLCSLSMGGYVAFAFARRYPQRLHGLILADTRPGSDTPQAQATRADVARLAENQGTAAIADLLLPRLLSASTRQLRPAVETRVRQLIDCATPAGIAAASRGMAAREDTTDLLSGLACPTLVIAGEQDALIAPQAVQEYAARIPGAQLALLANAGHLSNLEQPRAFLQAVHQFLATLS
ncbi:MAG TPA: alpha/beta fold hydrolase [Ktedonobacteraceae bacterium]|jgi:pimeloyl-ACP methyl ester carboxylesterase